MKTIDIVVGKTYRNRGAGRTQRTVLQIKKGLPVEWFSTNPRPDEPVVEFQQGDRVDTLFLTSFAKWAGSEV